MTDLTAEGVAPTFDPLTPHGWAILQILSRGPMREHLANPGLKVRLRREGLAVSAYTDPGSGYAKYLSITDAGRIKLRDRPASAARWGVAR